MTNKLIKVYTKNEEEPKQEKEWGIAIFLSIQGQFEAPLQLHFFSTGM
jgi:hypothetical protein